MLSTWPYITLALLADGFAGHWGPLGGCAPALGRSRLGLAMIEESREVRIVFDVPEGIRTQFATNLVAQHTDHEFIVTFFEVLPPILVGTPEVQKQQVEAIKEVRGTCLARIVIPASRMPDFIQVLQENHRRYLSGREGNE